MTLERLRRGISQYFAEGQILLANVSRLIQIKSNFLNPRREIGSFIAAIASP
jgi:hypothetical protein